jgi:hypothetical protein
VPEIIDPVFAKSSQNARFLLSENERFGLVFVKTGSKNSGTVELCVCKKYGVVLRWPTLAWLLSLPSGNFCAIYSSSCRENPFSAGIRIFPLQIQKLLAGEEILGRDPD